MEIFKSEKTYNFMGKRIPFLGLSLFLVLASIGLIFTKGLNLGVDFSGGTIVQVQYENAAPISKIRDELSKTTKYSKVNVTKFGSDQEVILKIPTSTNSISVDIGDEIRGILKLPAVLITADIIAINHP